MIHPEITVDLQTEKEVSPIDVRKPQAPFIEITDADSVEKHQPLSITVSTSSEQSIDSTVSIFSNDNPWSQNSYAKNYIIGLFTVFYAVILIIYAIVLELSDWFAATESNQKLLKRFNKNFNLYIFIVSYIFFAYCYILRCSGN